jgi:leucyl-tRNA synthetase
LRRKATLLAADGKYDHTAVEQKWQGYWMENKTYQSKVDPQKPKYYVLDMFPYPSGAGLHVGHVTGYTATDILARYKRQKGFNVLHPMGWDSFGLQAEQYAVRTGTHPRDTTRKNVDTYRRQLQSLGFSYDWDRELATSDPDYYKWTQWIFTKLYEKGMAYEAEILVNYCPELGTVLANEEVEDGKAKEGGFPVERRPLRQWVLKITAYAERLLEDLDGLDWPDYLKALQRNWIGKSQGAKITFLEKDTKEPITVFTTRPDTIFGVSFMVLSPEHPLVKKITTPEQQQAVDAYLEETAKKSDFERQELNKDKTGVPTGAYATNPVNGELIPIWIADYVLMGYGTGAVMGVPGGDERDFEFATKYGLGVVPPYDPAPGAAPDGVSAEEFRAEVLAGKRCSSAGGRIINGKSDKLDINGLEMEPALEAVADWLESEGTGERCTTYKLRDWLFSRQRYWGEPVPILHFEDGTKRALDLDELPLVLPDVDEYKPQGDAKTPLDNVTEWVNISDPKTGLKARRETNTMPQWAGSCWYYLRFCDPHNGERAWGEEEEKYWMPVDMYVGGVEHAVLHLLYSRFWHKVLYDAGYVSTQEPFQTLRNQGLVTAKAFKKPGGGYVSPEDAVGQSDLIEQVEKMSKSKLNGVTPDEIVKDYGADTLRLYEMFMGPFDKEKLWNSEALIGSRRFLDRFYALVFSDKVKDDGEGLKLAHKLVDGVQKDIDEMLFNTAISKLMTFVNEISKLPSYSKTALEMATQALAPFAPHMAEECWAQLGHEGTITYAPFPEADPQYLVEENATYVVQVNGKFRGKYDLPRGQTKDSLLDAVQKDEKLVSYMSGEIVKVIFVPDKLINVVVKA